MGCKKWTRGTQLGLRIYTDAIQKLIPILNTPSSDNRWPSLVDFLNVLKIQKAVPAYSRNILIISQSKKHIMGTMTIAKHGKTTQGYITAPYKSWLYRYIVKNMNKNFSFEYIPHIKIDLLVIPKHKNDILAELKNDRKKIQKQTFRYCRRKNLSFPPNAKEIGLFYEIKEKEYLEDKGFIVYHRYPYLQSNIPALMKKNISCDIDVFGSNNKFKKFVEVKAVAAAPGAEFNVTLSEYTARKKCKKENWNYEIVVYYHVGSNIIKRQVINVKENLSFLPSGYICFPIKK